MWAIAGGCMIQEHSFEQLMISDQGMLELAKIEDASDGGGTKNNAKNRDSHKFGGIWTLEKLDKLEKYLSAFTIALSKLNLQTVYIDAFAGTGTVDVTIKGGISTILGSARRSLMIKVPFHEYYFIDTSKKKCDALENLKAEFPDKKITIVRDDCNEFLKSFCSSFDKLKKRGVVFLDPFGASVNWATLKCIAETHSLDLWYLFPIQAVNRLAHLSADLPNENRKILDGLFGTSEWYDEFYGVSSQLATDGSPGTLEKKMSTDDIKAFIVRRLKEVFAFVAPNPRLLVNSKGSPLFLFCFAVSNPSTKAIERASGIARHILEH
jgi:three-Cys-motif partner protein